MLRDSDRKVSSKRIIALTSLVFLILFFILDIFTNYEVNSNIYRSLEWIIIAGLGAVGSEKFLKKYKKNG